MAKTFEAWNVLPHHPAEELAANLRAVQGSIPRMPLERRMTVAKLASGGLVIHNAVGLEDAEMQQLERFGKPELLVVPSGWHRLDAPNFKRRYPELKVVCPAGSRQKVAEVVPVDYTYGDAPGDSVVSFEHLEGVAEREGVMRVRSDDGDTLVFNDLLFNVARLSGFSGFVMTLMGSTGGPKVTRVGRWFVVKDKRLLRAHFERLATERVVRLIPGHGAIVRERAREVLLEVARAL